MTPQNDRSDTAWQPSELEVVVATYFEMLSLELGNKPYVKADFNRRVQAITGRSKGAIEYKMQNISAVLDKLGLPWILGYLPMVNFQHALLQSVEGYVLQNYSQLTDIRNSTEDELSEISTFFVEEAPSLVGEIDAENQEISRLIRKFDPAIRDSRNRDLGRRGEELVLNYERAIVSYKNPKLVSKIRWVSEVEGDGAGFDILSFDDSGREKFIEVKTTIGSKRTPFYISSNELIFSQKNQNQFRLIRLYDFTRIPKAFEIQPPLPNFVHITPDIYKASFG